MASMWLVGSLALLALVVDVSCLTCPEAEAMAEKKCQGHGCFIPACDGDEFNAVQCHGSGCYCVTPTGEEINPYWFGYGEYSNSECECAREQAAGENIQCKSDGDYM